MARAAPGSMADGTSLADGRATSSLTWAAAAAASLP